MAALTGPRKIERAYNCRYQLVFALKAGAKVFPGAVVVVDATGYAKQGAVATGLVAVGVCCEEQVVDNTLGADGALSVRVETGVFIFDFLGIDPPTRANVGRQVFIGSDHEFAATDGGATRSPVPCVWFDPLVSDKVYVAIGQQ